MHTVAFAGFGEVNTPRDVIVRKCAAAEELLKKEGLNLCSAYPVTDEKSGRETEEASDAFAAADPSALVLCVAGWISAGVVIRITERFRQIPVVLWGLSGRYEDGRLAITASHAGTAALHQTLSDLGYTCRCVYDVAGKPPMAQTVAGYCRAACAARELRRMKVGMMGYRDMNQYGTMFDGASLKRVTGVEIECFETLELAQRYAEISAERKQDTIDELAKKWRFKLIPDAMLLGKAAGYYLAASDIARERGYKAMSLKDADGMKALLGFPPAPVFMLLADADGISVVPEDDSLGCVTQLMIRVSTGQCGAYLTMYEFLSDAVLAGVPDFIPAEITDGDTRVLPAAFGELSQGLLNISEIRVGLLTICRLVYSGGKYRMHIAVGEGRRPRDWEECGWGKPTPKLPGIEIKLANVEDFAQKAASNHYFISYGDNRASIGDLCGILGIEVYE